MGYHTAETGLPCLIAWVITTALVLFLGTAIWDGAGREESEHRGPLPAGVERYSPSIYFVPFNVGVRGDDICGRVSGDSGVASTNPISRIKGAVVVCAEAQTWNSKKSDSLGFDTAFVKLVSNFYWITFEIALTLFLLFIVWFPFNKEHFRPWREARRQRKRNKINAERKRKEMGILYAKDQITDAEYRDALQRIDDMDGWEEAAQAT